MSRRLRISARHSAAPDGEKSANQTCSSFRLAAGNIDFDPLQVYSTSPSPAFATNLDAVLAGVGVRVLMSEMVG
jgi:hypothetical protein